MTINYLVPEIECWRCKQTRPCVGSINIMTTAAASAGSVFKPVCAACMAPPSIAAPAPGSEWHEFWCFATTYHPVCAKILTGLLVFWLVSVLSFVGILLWLVVEFHQ